MSRILGKKVGPYLVEALLGQGGMGTVYRALAESGERVALKILGSEPSRNGKLVERFRREAHAGSTLRHPHIVPVIDTGEYIGRPYLVMEYVEGRSLDIVFEDRRRLSPPEVLRLGRELGSALAYLHEQKFFHRDLKPANVLVDGERRARLTDFGLVKATELYALTQDGTLLGTMHYIPPEVIAGQPHTAAGDIYQLGLLLYEAATGEIPFGAGDLGELLQRRKAGLPPGIRSFQPSFPGNLDTLILNCLFPDPQRRYGDGGQFIGDLERCGKELKILRHRAVLPAGGEVPFEGPTAPTGGSSEAAGLSLASFAAARFRQDASQAIRRPRNAGGRPRSQDPRPSGAIFAPPPPEPRGWDALKAALRSLPSHMVLTGLVSLVFLLLAFRPWQFFGFDRSQVVARDFLVRRGVTQARVSWRSEAAYPSVLLLGSAESRGDPGRRVDGGSKAVTHHELLLSKLEAGKGYRVEILYPDGTRSFAHVFHTGRALAFGRHEFEGGDDGSLAVQIRSSTPAILGAKVFLRGRLLCEIPPREVTHTDHRLTLRDLPHPSLSATMVVEAKNHVGEAFPAHSIVIPSLADLMVQGSEAIDLESLIRNLAASHGPGKTALRKRLVETLHRGSLQQWTERFLPAARGHFANPEVGLDRKIALVNGLGAALLADEAMVVSHEKPVYAAREALLPFLRCGTRTVEGEAAVLLRRVGVIRRLPRDGDLFVPVNAPSKIATPLSSVSKSVTDLAMQRRELSFDFDPARSDLGDAAWVELGLLFRDDSVPGYWRAELNGSLILPLPNPIRRGDVPKRNVFETAVDVFGHHADEAERYRRYVWCRFPRFLLRPGRNRLRLRYGSFLSGTCYPAFLSTIRLVSVAGAPLMPSSR